MMELYKNIKELRKVHHMSQEELAKKTGYTDRSSIAKIEKGEVDLTQSKILAFANAFGITPDELMGNREKKPPVLSRIPLYGSICCGNGGFCDDEIIDYISLPPEKMNPHKSYFAQTAKGESMINAGIHPGDILVFEKTSVVDDNDIGCFCIDDNEAMCKRYRLKKDENGHIKQIILVPANDDVIAYPPVTVDVENQHFRTIGKLVFCIMDMTGR